jgi:hypothetical protein
VKGRHCGAHIGKHGCVLPFHERHEIELTGAGRLLQYEIADEADLAPQNVVRLPHAIEKFTARGGGNDEFVDPVDVVFKGMIGL